MSENSKLELAVNFYNRLQSHEKKTLKRFIQFQIKEGETNTMNQFLELLIVKPNSSEEYFIKQIYGDYNERNSNAFRKLLERFMDKTYESLLLDINIYNTKNTSVYYMNVIELRKLISLLHIVMARGVPAKEMNRLLNRGVSLSKKFEKFEELLIFLNYKLLHVGFIHGFFKQKELYEEISLAERHRAALFESRNLMFKYITDQQHKSIDDYKLTNEIKSASDRCRELYEETKLYNVLSDWYILEMQYCHYTFNYKRAEVLQLEFLNHIFQSPALLQKNRICDNYVNLAITQVYLYKYSEALLSINNAIKYAPMIIEAHNYYNDQLTFIFIYLKQYESALEVLSKLMKNMDFGSADAQISLRQYKLACTLFLMKDFKNCFQELQATTEIEDDRDGWNIGVRMLQIYLTLETEKIDLADKKIENLRKHIERTVKMKSIRKRDVVIFRLLTHLSRCGFDFKEVWEERQKDFKLLRSDDPDYRWIPRSHELILFDQWFESKVKNQPYEPVFPEPQHP